MPIPTYIAPSILKHLMYLLNVYSVFKVDREICPTLTYRTVLGKKRNTKIEKIQKTFEAQKAKSPPGLRRWAEVQVHMHVKRTYDFLVIGPLTL